jgi:hypothetical protein
MRVLEDFPRRGDPAPCARGAGRFLRGCRAGLQAGAALDDPPPPAERSVMHVIQAGYEQIRGMRLLIATVRLFANSGVEDHGPPIYEVVVGAPPILQ